MPQLILASQSPRRKQLLESLGLNIKCLPVDIDETPHKDENPKIYCERMAKEKAQRAFAIDDSDLPILASDTIVVFDNQILGKPRDEIHAKSTLKKLSGKTHYVMTSVAMMNSKKFLQKLSISKVQFKEISDTEINSYIMTKEPMDKAGSYGIQGYAGIWAKSIEGSYSGIMGLPLYETNELLINFNIKVL